MAIPGVCNTSTGKGPFCYLVTQLKGGQIYTQRLCSTSRNFNCIHTIPVTIDVTCTLLQYAPPYVFRVNDFQKYVKVFSQQMWYKTNPKRDIYGNRWTIINATLGTIRFMLSLSSFQITSKYYNCSRGAALRIAQLRAWAFPKRKRDLTGYLWDGANSVATIWNIYKNQQHAEKLGQLEKASGLITGAQLTQLQAGVGELHVISALGSLTQRLLAEMVWNITGAGEALRWDTAYSEIQDFLNDQLATIRSDL